jgi:hypothetical protein
MDVAPWSFRTVQDSYKDRMNPTTSEASLQAVVASQAAEISRLSDALAAAERKAVAAASTEGSPGGRRPSPLSLQARLAETQAALATAERTIAWLREELTRVDAAHAEELANAKQEAAFALMAAEDKAATMIAKALTLRSMRSSQGMGR